MVAAALLRMCYEDAHTARAGHAEVRAAGTGDRGRGRDGAFWAMGLVDAATWRRIAPATKVCRVLHDALMSVVGGVFVRVYRHVARIDDYDPATVVLPKGGSHGDVYWRRDERAAYRASSRHVLTKGKWLYFFPVNERRVARGFTNRLDRFLRACRRLRVAVDILDGECLLIHSRVLYESDFQHVFFFQPRPASANAAVTAAAVHLDFPVEAFWDRGAGRFAAAVEAAALAGSPRLIRRGVLDSHMVRRGGDDDSSCGIAHNYYNHMVRRGGDDDSSCGSADNYYERSSAADCADEDSDFFY